MRVSVFTDLRFTTDSAPTGVGKHIEQMVGGLHAHPGVDVDLIATRDQLTREGKVPEASSLNYLGATKLPLDWKVSRALWTLAGAPRVDRYCGKREWVYCPKNDYLPVNKAKVAVTIHGALELDPDVSKPRGAGKALSRQFSRMAYKRILERADVVLTVSKFLSAQMQRWFNIDPSKLVVVGNGVERVYFDRSADRNAERKHAKPYVLSVGGLNWEDGGQEIVATARILLDRLPDVTICVAGRNHDPELLVAAEALSNIELLGYVRSTKLAALMHGADALLYMPQYETFGIAAAEAMASGLPVVTAGGTGVNEVVGDAGAYVSRNPEEIAEVTSTLLHDGAMARRHIELGLVRAKGFWWEQCVERCISAMQTRS